jgi:hypothetical protein
MLVIESVRERTYSTYHSCHRRGLLPPIKRMAVRRGSKAKSTRRAVAGGRSSFMFGVPRRLDVVCQRPSQGRAVAFQELDRGGERPLILDPEGLPPGLELVGELDLP